MALDFCIKNNHGVVQHKIPIGLEEFYKMLEVAKNYDSPLPLIAA